MEGIIIFVELLCLSAMAPCNVLEYIVDHESFCDTSLLNPFLKLRCCLMVQVKNQQVQFNLFLY
jgi:hypothetical protein